MAKTFEALARAEEELNIDMFNLTDERRRRPTLFRSQAVEHIENMACLESLKGNLLTCFSEKNIKTVLFTGTSRGCGVTTTAIGLATALTNDSNLRVLLVDANLRSPYLHRLFDIKPHPGLSDILFDEKQVEFEMRRIGEKQLYVLPGGYAYEKAVYPKESERLKHFLAMVHSRIDFVIIDASGLDNGSCLQLFCRMIDGVVLVVEAGKTRRSAAMRVKKEIEKTGTRLLGLILNRKKYYIPEWIYKRL